MNPKQNQEQELDDLIVRAIGGKAVRFDAKAWEQRYPEEMEKLTARATNRSREDLGAGPRKWRSIMKKRLIPITAAAAAILLLGVGGSLLGPFLGGGSHWWEKPAWGEAVIQALAEVEGLVYRERFEFVSTYGSIHVSGSWWRHYLGRDRGRKNQYYDDTLVSTDWEVPEGNDLVRYHVSHEHQCYTITQEENKAIDRDPVKWFRMVVGLWEKADRQLGTERIEGRECVGFDISASKYGNNPEGRVERIWFDVESKLPALIERHGLGITGQSSQTGTFIQDQFEYYATLPGEEFEPVIPEGYVNAPPDEIHEAKELEEKGKMVYANVPDGLQEKIMAALAEIKTVRYETSTVVEIAGAEIVSGTKSRYTLRRRGWRKDTLDGEGQVSQAEWNVIESADLGAASVAVNRKHYRFSQTVVDYEKKTYRQVDYDKRSIPRHPLDRLLFEVELLDQADRLLAEREIEGKVCFGFEVSAKKYGSNPDTMKHRLWFDTKTYLPVQTEFEFVRETEPKKRIQVRKAFEWNPELSEETLVPKIPEGFLKTSE